LLILLVWFLFQYPQTITLKTPKPRKPKVGKNQYTMVDDMSGSTPLSVRGQGWSWAEIALDMGVGLGTVHRAGQMPRGS
jgi:hypothetical protein